MIVYVDLEHDRLRARADLWQASRANCLRTKYRLEDIGGLPVLVIRYTKLSTGCLHALGARAVVVSGCFTDFEHYAPGDMARLRDVYRAAAWPILGFCAGGQLMAAAYGATIGPLGPTQPGDPAPPPALDYTPGMRQERGFLAMQRLGDQPLFDGLGPEPVMFQSHYWHITAPPAGFANFASTPLCPVQVIVDEGGRLVGTQFHPEMYDDAHPDGRRFLENYFQQNDLIA